MSTEQPAQHASDAVESPAAHRERAAFYRLLAGIYYREMTAPMIDGLALGLADAPAEGELAPGLRDLRSYLARRGADARTDLAVDYARVFLAAGIYEGSAACPYESIYTSEDGLVMQEARDEVLAAYRACGFAVNPDACEPEDHVSFELEFMAALADRAADALEAGDADAYGQALRTQREFADAHLLNWIDLWGQKIEECAQTRFYPAVFSITRGFIAEDRALLDQLTPAA